MRTESATDTVPGSMPYSKRMYQGMRTMRCRVRSLATTTSR